MRRLRISIDRHVLTATLRDTATADKIWEALPIKGNANTWGDEIYFGIPVLSTLEPEARQEVDVGALAYWPQGSAFCIFFGRTPVSTSDKPRAYSDVNVFGSIEGDPTVLRGSEEGATVMVERAK